MLGVIAGENADGRSFGGSVGPCARYCDGSFVFGGSLGAESGSVMIDGASSEAFIVSISFDPVMLGDSTGAGATTGAGVGAVVG